MINWIKRNTVNQFNRCTNLSRARARCVLYAFLKHCSSFYIDFHGFFEWNELVRAARSETWLSITLQICSIILDHPARATLFFAPCIVIHALISEGWLNLEARLAFSLENLHLADCFSYLEKVRAENPPCFSNTASIWVHWSAALYGHRAFIEEYYSIAILLCVKAAHLI